jgi:hypothetical protein
MSAVYLNSPIFCRLWELTLAMTEVQSPQNGYYGLYSQAVQLSKQVVRL